MPYPIIGNVPRGEDYFGQEQLIENLWNRLEKDNILLTAPRRFGKTAAMYPDGHPKYPTDGHFKMPHLNSFKM